MEVWANSASITCCTYKTLSRKTPWWWQFLGSKKMTREEKQVVK